MTITVTYKNGTYETFNNVNSIQATTNSGISVSFIQNNSAIKNSIITLSSSDIADVNVVIQARDTPNE